MRRQVALTITLFHLFGAVGIPVAAYSCDESGQVGVISFLSGSERSCYVDSCCDGDETQASTYIQSDIPCCDLGVHVAPGNSRTLLPNHKYGQANPLADTPSLFDASLPDVRIASTPSSSSAFHPSINLPLLI